MAAAKVSFGMVESITRVSTVIKPVKTYVLVSGLDYHDIWSFNKYALNEKKRIDALANDKEIQIIYIVDILPGTITKIENDEGTITETVTNYDKITKTNYSGHVFDNLGKTNYITKDVIYNLVGDIGSTNSKSLMEIHIFSHAYWNGPILANTYESDPVDIDMRKNEIPSVASKFTNALNANGYVKIWGCSFPTLSNALYSRLRRNVKYKNSLIDEAEIFTYPANHFAFNLNGEDLDLVGFINKRLSTGFVVDKKIDLSFKQIKFIAAQDYLGLYAVNLAYYSNITVYAALPATYAEITPSFTISSKTQQNVNFFKTHLNVTIDSDNYGKFDRTSVITINAMTP
ncbi:hypothetical protein [Olleya sp. ITB9]|uniref:hypothetical protein n=1 Tax=Olleya sp. ITB9 TaxID=1715648 RepID=UPI0006CFBE7A|nr:hypothetical protein [Olleya sp. ITB9]